MPSSATNAQSTTTPSLFTLAIAPRLIRQRSRSVVLATPPPLPLISLPPDAEWEEFDTPTKTGFSYTLPHLEHLEADMIASTAREVVSPQSSRACRLLSDYMTQNEQFQTPRHGFGIDAKLVYKRSKEAESAVLYSVNGAPSMTYKHQDDINFSAAFESGNLDRAYRVNGRHYATTSQLLGNSSSSTALNIASVTSTGIGSASTPSLPFASFVQTDFEYDLYCDKDLNTHGHIQWYFFRSVVPRELCRRAIESGLSSLKVRFNIRNMLKKASLYNEGMLPAAFVEYPASIRRGWHHEGANVCYFKNADTYRNHKTGSVQNFYTLSFVYEFKLPSSDGSSPIVVYFAHCFPYTYSRLQRYLLSLQKDPERSRHFKRRTLCKTIAGNNCDMLTITDFSQEDESTDTSRTGIVLTARVHPGESNSSFVMHGILDFLTGPSLEARFLRHLFVFKVVPMLNPDGVIHGNYRCSLAGTDLNRRWTDPSPDLHPTVLATKKMILSLHRARTLSLYCDFHGHSRKKNIFLYGCRALDATSRIEATRIRLFPHILGKTSDAARGGYFSFADCTFSVTRSKKSTGRVVIWNECQVPHCFTMEASFFGVDPAGNGKRSVVGSTQTLSPPRHFSTSDLRAAGARVCMALIPFAQMLQLQRQGVSTKPTQVSSVPPLETRNATDPEKPVDSTCQPSETSTNGANTDDRYPDTGDVIRTTEEELDTPLFVKTTPLEVTCSQRTNDPIAPGDFQEDPFINSTEPNIQSTNEPCHTRLAPLSSTFSMERFSLSSDSDSLFSVGGEMSSMMALLDQDDMLKDIEASLPDNLQEVGNDTDDSVGSESDPSADDMEEEELERQRPVTPSSIPDESQLQNAAPRVGLPRKRPLLLRRNLSESRLYVCR